MTPEDQQAFQSACKDWAVKAAGQDLGAYFFKAACAHRDAQAAQVNQQMLEALISVLANTTWRDIAPEAFEKAKAAIAAAEKLNQS